MPKLTILGCNSATPTSNTHTTSQVLEMKNEFFLIDCGEGTQVQLRRYKVKFSRINNIFISHLHGDHLFGLPGLLSSFGLLGRKKSINIFAPKGIKEVLDTIFKHSKSHIDFAINFVELESKESQVILESNNIKVSTIPLRHRVYTNGYLFQEKINELKLNIDEVDKYPEIEVCDYQNIKNGRDFNLSNGDIIPNKKLTFLPKNPKVYAFCSDTKYNESIIPIIQNADLLYHESTFLEDKKDLAKKTGHSTAYQAGIIASKANVKKLILGHYSNRYGDTSVFELEAKQVFANTEKGFEGMVVEF